MVPVTDWRERILTFLALSSLGWSMRTSSKKDTGIDLGAGAQIVHDERG
jgi:hypothetical protein